MSSTSNNATPFRRLSDYLVQRYGRRVFKVSLRGGFTCPNRDGTVGRGGCTFCSGPALRGLSHRAGLDVEQQLSHGMAYIRKRHKVDRFIAYYHDYSATYAAVEHLARLYRPALDIDDVVALAVSTRPDCLPAEVLDLLQDVARRKDLWIELGLQIADDALLDAINRGHTVADFARATRACRERGLPVCAHVILGLPGATPAMERRTAELLAELDVWGVKLHAFHVLRGTKMADIHASSGLRLLSREEYVTRVVQFVERLPVQTIIHRITAETSRELTVAPGWTVNKLAVFDAIVAGFATPAARQGRLHALHSVTASVEKPS